MGRRRIGADLRREVAERAGFRCEYCLIYEDDTNFGIIAGDMGMAVNITEGAARRIRQALEKEGLPGTGGMRLGVKGGGCAGLNYAMRFEEDQKPGDAVFEAHGARIFVDMKSLLFLKGTTLDWAGDFMQQGFTFVNPNAQQTCSCGMSFQV